MMAGEDRFSDLPVDVIHHILSFLDMKFVVQTSALSHKWKNIWTTTPQISLDSRLFGHLEEFAEFTKQVLTHRNNSSSVASVELIYTGAVTKPFVKRIVNYAYTCSTRQLTIKLITTNSVPIPRYFFISRTLKHLSLSLNNKYGSCCIHNSDWNLPSLETLYLTNLQIVNASGKVVSLFAKCVMLKDLALSWMDLRDIDIFRICAPQLRNLTIKHPHGFPKVLNVASPQLNMETSNMQTSCFDILKLSTDGVKCLQNVNLSISFSYEKKRQVSGLLGLFQQLRNAKSLILDLNIVELLSSSMDVFSNKPCPFDDLKWLQINGVKPEQNDHKDVATMATQVKNYLLQNSPNATFTMDLSQVSVKRPRELVDNDKRVKKIAKWESKWCRVVEGDAGAWRIDDETRDVDIRDNKDQ